MEKIQNRRSFLKKAGLVTAGAAGASTLALLVLPVVILSTREALRAVPPSIREGSYALGATKWQTVWYQVLPVAVPGVRHRDHERLPVHGDAHVRNECFVEDRVRALATVGRDQRSLEWEAATESAWSSILASSTATICERASVKL